MRRYFFGLIYLLVSCGGLDDDNDQADNPVEVIDILLPQTRAALGRAAVGEYALYHAVFMQQLAGIDGMLLEIYRYNIEPVDTDKSWSDWRRTGYPSLDPAEGNSTDDLIPRRLPYPDSEYLLNPENVPEDIELTTPVRWDTN